MENFNAYLNRLSAFYNDLAYWRYSKDNMSEENEKYTIKVKESARLLREEIKKLPPDMVRPQVVEHIEKALSL